MTVFTLKRLVDYSDDEILAELRRVASLIDAVVITQTEFVKHSRVSKHTLRNHFGGWEQALTAAGLANRHGGKTVTAKMKKQASKLMSDADLLEELRSVAKQLGRDSITVEEFNSYSSIGTRAIRSRFGSWRAGLQKAGLQTTKIGTRYSDDECFENLLTVWTHFGRPPKYDEMKMPPSVVGPKAYVIRWKSWNRALHAFIERVNQDSDASPAEAPKQDRPKDVQKAAPLREEDQHKIKLGLRYKVLLRDNFKCIRCGSSPATNATCRLHVDHAIPWSKGGKTVIENLRTLCERCNLGKGNHLEQTVSS